MNFRITLIATGVAAIAITTATALYRMDSDIKPQDPVMPDAFMENVSATFLDKTGKITMKIETPRMIHYAKEDTTNFFDPHVAVYHRSSNPWIIAAKTATANHGIDHVLFRDDVTVHHPADFNNPATVIRTTVLTVHPNDKTAETAEAISMEQPNSVVTAIGMFADMDAGSIKLLSQAKGEYVPDS